MSTQKDLEQALAEKLKENKDIPEWDGYPGSSHHCFNRPDNGMTFDFAWPEYKFAIEVNGGQWARGKMGHNSGKGVQRDAEKNNWALLKGWMVIVLVTDHIEKEMDTYTMPLLRRAMRYAGMPVRDIEQEVTNLFDNSEEL